MKTLAAACLALFALAAVIGTAKAHAEDGYDLWLRYRPVASDAVRARYRQAASEIVGQPARGGSGGEIMVGPNSVDLKTTTLEVTS
ncbi:MAG TPA: hypothetical protein VNO35_06570 [Steroidobacteraceae bacterium]|nr:hypothetical protein [Steroidobacteraceae bacterium]